MLIKGRNKKSNRAFLNYIQATAGPVCGLAVSASRAAQPSETRLITTIPAAHNLG